MYIIYRLCLTYPILCYLVQYHIALYSLMLSLMILLFVYLICLCCGYIADYVDMCCFYMRLYEPRVCHVLSCPTVSYYIIVACLILRYMVFYSTVCSYRFLNAYYMYMLLYVCRSALMLLYPPYFPICACAGRFLVFLL